MLCLSYTRDVEAVEYFLLLLPLHIKLVASSCFLQSASASTSLSMGVGSGGQGQDLDFHTWYRCST